MSSDSMERRAWIRIGCDLEIVGRSTGRISSSGWTGKVHDISAGGLGLVLRHCFQPGTPLMIELRSRDGSLCRTLPVRVMRVQSVIDGTHSAWLLGCAFSEPLSVEELQRLI